MSIKNSIGYTLLLFVQSIFSDVYFFHSTGYKIEIITPENITLVQAIQSSTPVQISVISDSSGQEQLNPDSAIALIFSLLHEIDITNEQQGLAGAGAGARAGAGAGAGAGVIIESLPVSIQLTENNQLLSIKLARVMNNCRRKKIVTIQPPQNKLEFP